MALVLYDYMVSVCMSLCNAGIICSTTIESERRQAYQRDCYKSKDKLNALDEYIHARHVHNGERH